MITHVFLDLDGVISDFHSECGHFTKEEWQKEFYRFVMRAGFVKLNKLPDADKLMSFLDSLNVPITILSSAGGVPDLYDDIIIQKHQWLINHGIKYPALVVPSKGHKANYSMRGHLLIDDQQINCDEFLKMGGLSIQHVSAEATIERIKEINFI